MAADCSRIHADCSGVQESCHSNVFYFCSAMPHRARCVTVEMKDVLVLIEKQVKEHDIMLFMKGTPSQPQCGFSLQTVRVLNAVGANFSSINVLEYPAIREGIKLYSEWPTIPQLYVKGEFIGGCDIVTTMFKDGELEALMKEKNLISKD